MNKEKTKWDLPPYDEIPTIEPNKDKTGYWAIYPDKKVWHNSITKEEKTFLTTEEVSK